VRWEIKDHPKLFEGYTKGHGIITVLRVLETQEGKRGKKQTEADEEAS